MNEQQSEIKSTKSLEVRLEDLENRVTNLQNMVIALNISNKSIGPREGGPAEVFEGYRGDVLPPERIFTGGRGGKKTKRRKRSRRKRSRRKQSRLKQ